MLYDLTVIICATNLVDAYNVCKSIESTCGSFNVLFLVHDNSVDNMPLAKVYNRYSKIASSDLILFAHLDVVFYGCNWLKKIIDKMKEESCGAIGYAGSIYRPKNYYGCWPINFSLSRCNYRLCTKDNIVYIANKLPYEEVINLDGLALFAKRLLVIKFPFDEKNLLGFHCYDIDFTMNLATNGYKLYVYTDKSHTIFHKSCGKYSKAWVKDTLLLTQKKWNSITPLSIQDVNLTLQDYDDINRKNQEFANNVCKYFSIDELQHILSLIFPNLKIQHNMLQYNSYNINCNGYRSWN